VAHVLREGRGAWLQIAEGSLRWDGAELAGGDGASTESAGTLEFTATAQTEALLFDLA
jgi:redox-sensitive bicupin YhaK (pirin superfamily)